MNRIIRAELLRLVRRRTLMYAAAASIAFSVVATLAVFASADAVGGPPSRGGTTLDLLSGDGGGTQAFAVGASYGGFFVFVTFIALIASEFSGGTFRALLLRNPHRLRLIVGKLVGILVVAAGVAAFAEASTLAASLALAPGNDISTADWFSAQSGIEALRDYATVMGGVTGWAIFGTTLAVVFRSVPVAIGVGFLWAGPFENITVDSWSTGYRVFPGQVLGSLIQGGTAELAIGRATLTALLYTAVAAAVALLLVSRRDVSS